MEKELFEEWCKWLFDILFKIESETDYSQYIDYNAIRAPAFVAERFFNVWLRYEIENYNIKIKETPNYLLDDINPKIYPFLIGKLIKYKYKIIINLFGIKITLSKKR